MRTETTAARHAHHAPAPALGPAGPARLLLARKINSWTDHQQVFGPVMPTSDAALGEMLRASALRGRGGAGFPTATKIAAVSRATGRLRRAVVVANCCEGDPTSAKDRVLLSRAPHLVIDGALVAGAAVNADRVIFAAHQESQAADMLRRALAERGAAAGAAEVIEVPNRFVASEASALVRFLNTGDARPLGKLLPVWETGVDGRPTLIDNCETLAQLALIARFGEQWFRSVGVPDEPGTALVTIGGVVPRARVLEVATGTPIREIIAAAGAPCTGWALFGGIAGRWVDLAAVAHARFSTADLAAVGAARGVGSIIVLPSDGCLLTETARILAYLADSGARQCGPCMFGLPAIAADMRSLASGDRDALRRLRRRLPSIDRRGGCGHPDGAVALAASAVSALTGPQAPHLHRHLSHRGCRPSPPVVPLGAHVRPTRQVAR